MRFRAIVRIDDAGMAAIAKALGLKFRTNSHPEVSK